MSLEPHQQQTESHHGNTGASTGIIGRLGAKNRTAHTEEVDRYRSYWEEMRNGGEKNTEEARLEEYTSLTNAYYNLVTDFYEYGWGRSFHFARMYPGESFAGSIARHEHFLAMRLGLKPGMRALDVGCGVGGPQREIVHFTGAHVTGFNNNAYQLTRATEYAAREKISDLCSFIKGNFMEMDIPESVYDAVYAFEATVHAPRLAGVYGEIFRVLRPGARFANYEWVMTDKYDPTNPEHAEVCRAIEEGNGIPKMYGSQVCIDALKEVGFEIEFMQDMSDMGDEVPWYQPLAGGFIGGFAMSQIGMACTDVMVRVMEKVGLAPAGTHEIQSTLRLAADYLVRGGKLGIFTPMFFFVARKPLDAAAARS